MKILFGVLLCGCLALALTVSDGRSFAGQSPSRVVVFEDRHGGNSLTIETALASADLGRFAFRVPGRGVFIGVGRPVVEQKDSHQLKVRYQGPIDQIPDVAGATPSRVNGRLEAELDAKSHQGQAQLRLETGADGKGDHFDIETGEFDAQAAIRAARAFEAAAVSGDWRSVYGMLASTVRTSTTVDGFVSSIAAQSASVGTLVALQRGATSDVQFAAGAVPFVIFPYTATHRLSDGRRITRRFDAYFAFEEGSWRLWFTDER